MKLNRRQFLKVGAFGGIVLAGTGYVSNGVFWGSDTAKAVVDGHNYSFFTVRDHEVMVAIATVLLEGGFESGQANPVEASVEEVVQAVDYVISGFLPEVQAELRQLFTLLTFAPMRTLAGGPMMGWKGASPDKVRRFLEGWRYSSFDLLKSGYDALVQLTMGSWYGNQKSWSVIGYPGPPNLGTA
jgi:hypothetical protein